MGLFLALSGIAQVSQGEIERALRDYVSQKSGIFESDAEMVDEANILTIASSLQNNITVVYPDAFLDWDKVSLYLSTVLRKPVFSFHIHDGDFWMYRFFVNGQEVDHFNPMPDYWDHNITNEERKHWAGNVQLVCQYWPNIQEQQIANYLVSWDLTNEEEVKAYPDDKYSMGEDWQLIDFMDKLGLSYPIDDNDIVDGTKYRFVVGKSTPDSKSEIHHSSKKPW